MDKEKISYLTDEVLMKKFLLNFVPGLPLYFALDNIIGLPSFEGLSAFMMVITVAWTLGLCFEILLFNTYYKTKTNLTNENSHYLLISKFSLAICFAFIIEFILLIIESVDNDMLTEKTISRIALKKGVIVVLALISWFQFKGKLKSSS